MPIQSQPIPELTENCSRFKEYLVAKGINAKSEGFPIAATFELAELLRHMQGTDTFKPTYLRVYHGLDQNKDLHVFIALLDAEGKLDTSATGQAASIATGTETIEPDFKGLLKEEKNLNGTTGGETQALQDNPAPAQAPDQASPAPRLAAMDAIMSTSMLRMAAKIPPGNDASDAILSPIAIA